MSQFLTTLVTERIDAKRARLVYPLVYQSDLAGVIRVPSGFVTDFASVPRLPFTFWLTGDTAHEAAVVHDYLYTDKKLPRATADAVFLEAMGVLKVPLWRRRAMYLAVRVAGGWRRK